MNTEIQQMHNQDEFDNQYMMLRAKLADILSEQNYLGNAVLLALCAEMLSTLAYAKQCEIHEAKEILKGFIDSINFTKTN